MNDIECSRCGKKKPPTAFSRNASKRSGRDSECLRCKRARENTPEAREAKRIRAIAKKYGLTRESYEALALKQCNLCAICGEPEKKTNEFGEPMPLSVDHDHTTNRVRGLLCSACNKGIGLLGDTWDRVFAASVYLRRRFARCPCMRVEMSSADLAFFEARPGMEFDAYYCGCRGWD